MNTKIPSGIPNNSYYASVVGSDTFIEMERFSREFLAAHPVVQASYGWVSDPLHQWSRQWEYPFVYQAIREELQRRTGTATDILDAGSGATFFPFSPALFLIQEILKVAQKAPALDRVVSEIELAFEEQTGRNADLTFLLKASRVAEIKAE